LFRLLGFGTHSPNDIQQLIAHYSNELSLDRTNSIAYLRRAENYMHIGEIDKAIADYREGLRTDPDNKDLQNGLKSAKAKKSEQSSKS